MELQLHRTDYYFFQGTHNYKVMCVAFEDGTFAVYVFVILNGGNDAKGIGSFDVEKEPTSEEAKEFLIKALS